MKYPPETWKWFGFAGHLCVSNHCRFHMTTQVGPWLISTVGAYYPPHEPKRTEPEEVGLNRLYETYVFRAGEPCTTVLCGCGMPSIDGHEIDSRAANSPGEAADYHMKLCYLWADREFSEALFEE